MEEIRTPGATCRVCGDELKHTFCDLGMSPPCQTQVDPAQLNEPERFYPLHVWVCDGCFLVQLEEHVPPEEIFTEYAYFSSYADSWVEHARAYAERMISRFGIDRHSLVCELASNDGYLLQHFVARSVPVLGIEPAANVAQVAIEKGIRTEVQFFGLDFAKRVVEQYGRSDLVIGNNVLAQIPAINDFIAGIEVVLADRGVVTLEFPHLYRLVERNQFDTIYHEHFSYFWFSTAEFAFGRQGLTLFDVEELPTHGGSIRIYGRHTDDDSKPVTERVAEIKALEQRIGYDKLDFYSGFDAKVKQTKRKILACLIDLKNRGKSIVGYGAPGKGNTLLNYCGIRSDLIEYTVDRNPYKQGAFTPGTHIPILAPEAIRETKPDFVFILPWNLEAEIVEQNAFIREWGGKFIVPIPEPRIVD